MSDFKTGKSEQVVIEAFKFVKKMNKNRNEGLNFDEF